MKLKTLGWLMVLGWACHVVAAEPKVPTTPEEKVSYALTAELVTKMLKEKVAFDADMAVQGIRDAAAGKSQMNEEEVRYVLTGFQAEMRRKVAANKRQAAMQNRERGEKFFAANKTKEGVVTLPNGTQYKIISAGNGVKPADGDFVQVNYRGSLLDGTEFDRSVEGKPANLKVSGLISGWRTVMPLIPVGSKWQVWIPSALAYGERGAGSVIGPNEALVFDIELVGLGK